MAFSARTALLNDDEEWFNIPPVVRNILRQLNNEVHGNRLSLDTMLTNYQEQNDLIKGGLSKQLEREVEMSKTILMLQQDREEGENSLRNIVETFRDQLRRINEDQRETRDRIRQLEEKESERTGNNDSLRSKYLHLSKTVNQRVGEMETFVRNGTENLTRIVEKIDMETKLHFQKHDVMGMENRGDIERFNQALHQLCDAVSEDVDNLRLRLQDHENALQEIRQLSNEEDETHAKFVSQLRDNLKETETIVRHLESSSDNRFESVFGTLEKSQSLIDKLSKAYERQAEEQSSIMKVLSETRSAQARFSEEILTSFHEKMKKHDVEIDEFHRHLNGLHSSKDAVEELFSSECTVIRSDIENIRSCLNKIESNLPKTTLREDLKGSFSEMFSSEKKLFEEALTDLHNSITHEQSMIREEVEYLKKTLSNLESKCDQRINRPDKPEAVRESTRVAAQKEERIERALRHVREEIKEMRDAVSRQTRRSFGESESDAPESVVMAMKIKIEELKTTLDQIQLVVGSQGIQLNEIQQKVNHHDTLVKDIPKCVQLYLQDVDDKLSPTLLELDVLRKRITSLEVGSFTTHVQEPKNVSYTTEEDLEDVKVKLRNNQLLHSTQRQLQSTEVRLDNLHSLNQSLERKIDVFSKELSDVADVLNSLDERENQKDLLMRNEVKNLSVRVCDLEDEVEKLLRRFDLRTKSPTVSSDAKNIETSLEVIRTQIRDLENGILGCVTRSSVEWIELRQEVAKHSRKLQEDILSDRTLQNNEILEFAPLSRVLANEETLNILRKEMENLQNMVKSSERILESNNGTLPESEVTRSLEQRLCHLEASGVHRTEMVLLSRVDSIEKVLSETQAKISTMCSTSEKVELFDSRLSVVEKRIHEDNRDPALGMAFPALLDRLAVMEGALGNLSRESEKNIVDLLSYEQRIKQLEEQKEHREINDVGNSNCRCEETLASNVGNNTLTKTPERLREIESDISSLRSSISIELQSFYTKAQMDVRLENIWASFIGLLTRKGDQETIDQKLGEVRRLISDDVSIQINGIVRDMQRAIDERVKVSEVRELLRGT